jgi:hypothetical membrane protein
VNKTGNNQNINASSASALFKLYGFLALAGITGPWLLLGAELIVPLSLVNYSPLRDSISMLVWSGLGWIQSATLLIAGLLLEVFAAVLFLGIRGAKGFKFGILLLTLSGFGLLVVGAFPTDLPHFAPTLNGMIHGIASKTTFLLLPLAILLIAPSLRKDPYWRPMFGFSIAIVAVTFIWMTIYRWWSPQELGLFGLYERVLAAIEIIWIEVMAFWLLRLFLTNFQNTPAQIPVSPGFIKDESTNTPL